MCGRLQIEGPVFLSGVLCEDDDNHFHGIAAEIDLTSRGEHKQSLLMISFMMKFQSRVGHQLEAVLKPFVICNGEC